MHEHVKLFLTVDAGVAEHRRLVDLHMAANDLVPDTEPLHDQAGFALADLEPRLAQVLARAPEDLVQALPDAPLRSAGSAEPDPAAIIVGLYPVLRDAADALHALLSGDAPPGLNLHADLPIGPADLWRPHVARPTLLGTLDRALALMGADALGDLSRHGEGVNIVIIDQGIAADHLPQMRDLRTREPLGLVVQPNIEGDLVPARTPGTAAFGHGTKMAQLALALAPRAQVWDVPLLPARIRDFHAFCSDACAVMTKLRQVIADDTTGARWVICNAWSVYDLGHDHAGEAFTYATNLGHALNAAVAGLAGMAQVDVVFAAGNCGQFCPDGRCGHDQVGPGNSIYGVAALAGVLTVGAVRNDSTWLGYSAQGPSPEVFSTRKPDLCAPSHFTHRSDARIAYTGTSSACALAVGAIAALRGRSMPRGFDRQMPSGALYGLLSRTAQRLPGQDGEVHPWVGAGILNLRGLPGLR